MSDRMEVLIDGEWVDVSNTVRDFGFEETTAEEVSPVDDVTVPTPPFELSIPIDPDAAAHLFAMIEEGDRRHRAERARRRLWLRFPYRGANRREGAR